MADQSARYKGTWRTNKAEELDDDPKKNLKGKKEHWGYHLLLDVSDCNEDIDDEDAVEDFIKQLVKDLDMTALGDCMVVRVSGEDGRGISAVQIITTSTITFHGDDDKWSAYIDVFSCKPFEPETAIKLVKARFSPGKVGTRFIHRDAGRWPES